MGKVQQDVPSPDGDPGQVGSEGPAVRGAELRSLCAELNRFFFGRKCVRHFEENPKMLSMGVGGVSPRKLWGAGVGNYCFSSSLLV